jgi:hypothetical protein
MDVTAKLSSVVDLANTTDLESFLTRIYQLHAGVGRSCDGLNVSLKLHKLAGDRPDGERSDK